MNSIYKYKIEAEDVQIIKLPVGASILCVQSFAEEAFLYAVVDLDTEETEDHTILTFGTGYEIADNLKAHYIGTFQMAGGSLVFHVFEKVR